MEAQADPQIIQYPLYPYSQDLRLLTFSYLNGDELFHKIALLNKKLRLILPSAGLLDQHKMITIRCTDEKIPDDDFVAHSFMYAISWADSF